MTHQVWIRACSWHLSHADFRLPIDTLLDTGAGGGNYVSFWLTIRDWSGCQLSLHTRRSDRGTLRAANPRVSAVPLLRIRDTSVIPGLFPPEERVRKLLIWVVKGLPYDFILEATLFRHQYTAFFHSQMVKASA